MKKIALSCICALLLLPLGAAVRHVGEGDDLYRAIRTLGDNDTLVVAKGNYTLDAVVSVKRNTVIVGEEGACPQISLSSFRLGTGAGRLVLRNLALTLGSKHLVGTPSAGDVEIDLVAFEGCSIDLGGQTGGGLVNSRTPGTNRNRIGEIRVEDCVVFNGAFPQHFVYSSGSTSQTQVGKISLVRSTFADMSRGAVATNAAMKIEVGIDQCTFYDINRSDNTAGTIRLGNVQAVVRVTRSLFTFAGPRSRFIVVGAGSDVKVGDSYMTGELASIPGARGLKILGAKAAEAFEAPARNPLAEGTSLRIADESLSGVGDPRWN